MTALDWQNVLAVAQENARAAGVADRFRTIAGSAFDLPFGGGYDLVLLPNFLHHFDPEMCERLLAKSRAALAPGGRVVLVEFIPDEDRLGPPDAVRSSASPPASRGKASASWKTPMGEVAGGSIAAATPRTR